MGLRDNRLEQQKVVKVASHRVAASVRENKDEEKERSQKAPNMPHQQKKKKNPPIVSL